MAKKNEWFEGIYTAFCADSANAKFLFMGQVTYGRLIPLKGRQVLGAQGLCKFALENQDRLHFCPKNMNNFMRACMSSLDDIKNDGSRPRFKGREFPTILPLNQLYDGLMFGAIHTIEAATRFGLEHVLKSTNTLYLMELAHDRFYVGHSLVPFGEHLKGHPAYHSKTGDFTRFYGIYLLGDSTDVDGAALKENFFSHISEILAVKEAEPFDAFIVCPKEHIRRALEVSFLVPHPRYNGLVEPVINTKVLGLLNTKDYLTFLKPAIQGESEKAEE